MAMSKELLDKQQASIGDQEIDLTLCGICEAPIVDPKALPCLHTFCLGCIEEWAWAKGKTGVKIACPLCKEEFVIPSEGVSGFRSNFFVTKLKKAKTIKKELVERKITSDCCENKESALARCLDCKNYLCTSCVQAHKTIKHFKDHRVYSFDDIRSGKVDVHKLHVQEYCTKHKGQVLWFFCETCGNLICRDCTVVDHPASSHMLVNVEEVSGAQSERLDALATQCQQIAERVADAIKIAEDVEDDLRKALQEANKEVDQVTLEIIEHLKVKQQKYKDEISQAGDECRAKITAEKDKLQSQHSQLGRALEIADTVSKKGSPYDQAAIFTTLTDTMQKLSDIEPVTVSSDLADVKFVPNDDHDDLKILPEFGMLTTPAQKSVNSLDLTGKWEMTSQWCKQDKLNTAMGIALYPSSGDFAVTSYSGQVKVFNENGTFKHDINVKQDSVNSQPRSVAISNGNHVYVTDTTPCVKVFDANAKLINKFESVAPSSLPNSTKSSLYGLAIGHENRVIVGDCNNSYISIHKMCGTHLNSFKTSIKPSRIATAPYNNTIIISQYSPPCVQILDYTGQVLHTVDRPTGVDMAWKPTGICFNGDEEFLIASQRGKNKKSGIHRYTSKGDYLGCITREVNNPTNVVITRDDKLLVLEWTEVKVFSTK